MGSASSDREKAVAASSVIATTTARLTSVLRRMAAAAPSSSATWPPKAPPRPSRPASRSTPVRNLTMAASARHNSTPMATANTATTARSSKVSRVEMRWIHGTPTLSPLSPPLWLAVLSSLSGSLVTPDQPLAHGVESGLGAALEAKLREQVGYVRFHRRLGDVEMLGDALVRAPLGDVGEHLDLALGQRLAQLRRPHLAHQALLRARVEAHLAARGRPHRLEEVVRSRLLEHVAGRTGLDDVDDHAVFKDRGERDNLYLGVQPADLAGGFHPVHHWH